MQGETIKFTQTVLLNSYALLLYSEQEAHCIQTGLPV